MEYHLLNTICHSVHIYVKNHKKKSTDSSSLFSPCTNQGHGSLRFCTASLFLLHGVFSLKAVLPQLSVLRPLDLPELNLSTRAPEQHADTTDGARI